MGKTLADGRVKFDGCEADVKISDESGKIPLSSMDAEKFVKIFEEWGMFVGVRAAGGGLHSRLVRFRRRARRLRGGVRRLRQGRGAPPNRAFKSFSELAFVKNANEIFFDADGNPTDFYRILSENFSLENFSKVNLNSASEETLAILCELESEDYDPDLYRAIRGEIGSVDDGKYWVESLSDIENRGARFVPRAMAAASASLLKIEVTARRGIAEYKIVAFYGTETSSGVPEARTARALIRHSPERREIPLRAEIPAAHRAL